jgi:hypothetical protein
MRGEVQLMTGDFGSLVERGINAPSFEGRHGQTSPGEEDGG